MSRGIRVAVDKQGNAQATVFGVCGASCVQMTQFLEEALGKTVDEAKTAEFNQVPPETVKVDRTQ
jgi:hypothetical protein